jgi:hypothetical protein
MDVVGITSGCFAHQWAFGHDIRLGPHSTEFVIARASLSISHLVFRTACSA